MRRLTVISLTDLTTVALMAGGAASIFTVRSTPDGVLLLYSKQAKECDEGGTCTILSEREFKAMVSAIILQMRAATPRQQRWDETS